jgi:hypothetical protein
LRHEWSEAKVVLVGHAANPRAIHVEGAKVEEEITDFHISEVLKGHPALGRMKVIHLRGLVPVPNLKKPPQFIVFVDVVEGKLDPYRGLLVDSPKVLDYLKGIATLKVKPEPEALAFFAGHLSSDDEQVAADAAVELGRAEHGDLRRAAARISADHLRRLVKDKASSPYIFSTACLLLGLCGSEADARSLREHIDNLSPGPPLEQLLIGYILLEYKAGHGKRALAVLNRLLGDQDFRPRYVALRAVRFFWKERPDVISREDRLAAVALLLDNPDIADLAIDDLRKWRAWEMAGRIVELDGRETHNAGYIRRAILRYALQCPDAQAREFVQVRRVADAELVQDTEDLLRLEAQ